MTVFFVLQNYGDMALIFRLFSVYSILCWDSPRPLWADVGINPYKVYGYTTPSRITLGQNIRLKILGF